MTYIILLFGIFIIFAGMVLIVRPDYIMNHFRKYEDSFSLHFFAVFVRIVLGIAFVIGASGSKYPLILQIFGWLSFSAALVLSVIGRENFKRLIKWTTKITPLFRRLMGFFAILLGCFFIYAVI
jgi:hypothetical protein